jgi:peptide/nickel transport system permease protein
MLIAIPLALLLGVFLYRKRNEKIAKLFDTFSVMLLSIPVFWLATLCVVYLSSDYYGIGIFKNIGLWHPSKTGFFQNIDKLILPITILVLLDVAYLTKLFKASATEEHKKPYVQSLIAKGLSEKQSINRHLLKNALIPIITLIVGALPQAFAGSLLLEVIFNIPGMGRLMYDSIYAADYNTSTAIILIVVLMTIISYWMGDLLYRKVNPKIYYH